MPSRDEKPPKPPERKDEVVDPSDEIARMRAQMDQLSSEVKEFAGTTAAFFNGLVEEGLERSEALMLTAAWLTALVQGLGE